MPAGKDNPDPLLEQALEDLRKKVEAEPISPHLRELAQQLERALAEAARRAGGGDQED
ncbi:MAG: hypothetical protein Q4G49_09455 [Paracoccus sp. (in: a-proteobacteria)]|nr:hypothetical protein [Paracoccus sp. (in: a-proteobacteria)]